MTPARAPALAAIGWRLGATTWSSYYREINSNVHRGAHALSDRATSAFEGARDAVCRFINSPSREQVIWTRGTTESINLVAATFARSRLRAGDEILV